MIEATVPDPTVRPPSRIAKRRPSSIATGWISSTGRVERGTLHVSDEVEIIGIHEDVKKTVVTGIEMFRKLLDEAQAGDNIGALLRDRKSTRLNSSH